MSRVVQVDIHGQRYAVRSDLDPHVHRGAGRVPGRSRCRSASRELSSADPLRIAVIAALNIVDELLRARADSAGSEQRLHLRAEEIERMVDAVLEDARVKAVNE